MDSKTPKSTSAGTPSQSLFHAGSLSYTRTGVAMLTFWLLWGFFIYALMERVIPTLLPLILKQHHATNTQVSFITTSLNVIGNMVFNPLVSFASDRYRSPLGRRRPYILWTTPLVMLFLALIPFGPEISIWLQTIPAINSLLNLSPIVPSLLIISIFVMGFQIFDTFIGAVYYYLVRDVVPEELYGRFMGVFRLVGTLAPLVYNLFIFGHAEQHMKFIFVGISIIYGIGIYAMCWRVKEGEFPPPEPLRGNVSTPWRRCIAAVRTYFEDCFKHRIYWFFFLAMGMMTWGSAAGVFAVLFQRDELGINLATQGKLGAAGNIVVLIFAVPLGYLVDKLNSFRIVQVCVLMSGFITGLGWFFIQGVPSLFVFTLVLSVIGIGSGLAVNKVMLRLIPKEKYGQFGSANSAFGSLGMVLMSVLAAKFVDKIGTYRGYLLWSSLFVMGATPFFILCERTWLKLGGSKDYKAP